MGRLLKRKTPLLNSAEEMHKAAAQKILGSPGEGSVFELKCRDSEAHDRVCREAEYSHLFQSAPTDTSGHIHDLYNNEGRKKRSRAR